MLPQMRPYTPSLYQPNGYGRYRQYPRQVMTPIPGAGYDVGEMVWAEQELNLDGSSESQPYGNYAQVPLRGLGALQLSSAMLARLRPQLTLTLPGGGSQGGPAPTESTIEDVASVIYQAPPPTTPPPEVSPGFFERKVGPVPVWAIGAGTLALAVGGAGWWWMKRRRK